MAVTIEELTIEVFILISDEYATNLTLLLSQQNELFRNKANSLNAIVDRARELKEKNEQLETQMLVNEEEKKVSTFSSNDV
jgi:hypothetical protein